MVGLWPYEQSKLTRLQRILFSGTLITFILVQFATFATSKCTPQFVIEVLSVTFLFIAYAIEYTAYWIHLKTIKHLLELLQHIYDELNDEEEIAIMNEYGNMARYHTGILTIALNHFLVLSTCGMSVFTLFPFWPCMFDIAWPANESRPHTRIYIPTEYFIDQERYYYLIMLHSNVAYYVGSTALLAAGTTGMSYFLHICGMFKVASYRVEQAMMICSVRNQNLIHEGIIYAIDMHRKAISVKLMSQIFQVITFGFDLEKLIIPFICLNTTNIFIILANNNAQQITDHNDDMFAAVYNVKWYNASLRIQKMILFMLQKGTKPLCVTLGGIFTGSLESAARLISTSMSYFTVLYSTRQNM
ncbi:PREDICTED: uncharacterized protein LOC106746675 [Dinoponera quadriceps]|uniref:Odorant receptor n=1 Tax=Dinoponera quadriceps TaxID=609295 RepID=A0A6P3XLV5_DINQU|nr:PREDICTED: uncharacterized protein LOC106746675 [Dinoponera quadriceps]